MRGSMPRKEDTLPMQVLEFLTVTGTPERGTAGDEESRRIVRSHAIRDANRRKKKGAKNTPVKVSAKPLPQSNYTAKFRVVSKPKRKVNENHLDEADEVDKSLEELSNQIRFSRKSIHIAPGGSRFDPFDTLPVTIRPHEAALIEFSKHKVRIISQLLMFTRTRGEDLKCVRILLKRAAFFTCIRRCSLA
jgi:hypothetical protein